MDLIATATILGAILIGAISPGPSFVVVVRTSIAHSRVHGLAAALGMGLGAMAFSCLALFGLHALVSQAGSLYFVLKLAGAVYLAVLAYKLWRAAPKPITVSPSDGAMRSSLFKSFSLALLTQVSNPKTAIVYGSIFASLLPPHAASWIYFALPPLVLLIETGWYAVVAFAFSAERPRGIYLRSKTGIDRLAAVVMGGLAARLMFDAAKPD